LPEALARVGRVEVQGQQVTVRGPGDAPTPLVSEVVNVLAAQGVPFRDLRTEQATLEDVFLSLTGRAVRA